jgi:hypothetical protein
VAALAAASIVRGTGRIRTTRRMVVFLPLRLALAQDA